MSKLSFVSKAFGSIQLIFGLASMGYAIWVLSGVGDILALPFDARKQYSGLFLSYFGGGFVHLFTAACILSRQSAAAFLALLVGLATMGIRIPEIMKNPIPTSMPAIIAAMAFLYAIWFLARQKEFDS